MQAPLRERTGVWYGVVYDTTNHCMLPSHGRFFAQRARLLLQRPAEEADPVARLSCSVVLRRRLRSW